MTYRLHAHKGIYQHRLYKALNRDVFVSLQSDVEYDKLVPYRSSNPRDSLERHKVKVTHAQRARCERECGRFDMAMGVQGTMHMYRRAACTGVACRDGKVFRISRTPSEAMCALGERCATQRWLTTMQLREVPEGKPRTMYGANTTREGSPPKKKTGVRCEGGTSIKVKGMKKINPPSKSVRTYQDWLAARRRRLGTRPHLRQSRAVRRTRSRAGGAMRRRLGHAEDPNASQ